MARNAIATTFRHPANVLEVERGIIQKWGMLLNPHWIDEVKSTGRTIKQENGSEVIEYARTGRMVYAIVPASSSYLTI